MRAKRQLERFDTAAFLAKNPVFTLEDLRRALGGAKGRRAALERVKYYLKRGKLKPVSRGVYAAVPGGLKPAATWSAAESTARTTEPNSSEAYVPIHRL